MKKRTRKVLRPSPLVTHMDGPLVAAYLQSCWWKSNIIPHITRKHKPAFGHTQAQKCPCEAFKMSDAAWIAKTDEDKAAWNAAVKRPVLSGYQLWMKEAIHCLVHDRKWPANPSLSGGFSFRCTELGDDAPEDFIGKAPPNGPPGPPTDPPPGDPPCDKCITYTPHYIWIAARNFDPIWQLDDGVYYCRRRDPPNNCTWLTQWPYPKLAARLYTDAGNTYLRISWWLDAGHYAFWRMLWLYPPSDPQDCYGTYYPPYQGRAPNWFPHPHLPTEVAWTTNPEFTWS